MPHPFPTDITLGRLRDFIAETLTGSDTPALDALILLETAVFRDRAGLLAEFRSPLTDVLSESALEELASLVEQRRQGVSIAYITGAKEFYGYEFYVGAGALVPRPESEHLVEEGLRLLARHHHAVVHDCCTGTGCIGVSLARERAARGYTTDLILSDIEPAALGWATRNAERLLSSIDKVHYSVERRDVLKPVRPDDKNSISRCDLITANPPYLTEEEMRQVALGGWTEPTSALDGGTDGLAFYSKLASQAFSQLHPERYVLVEHGWTQGAPVRTFFVQSGFDSVDTTTDLAGRDRLVRARRPADNS